ncbi:MAG TPA: bacillithiol biosynthesis cysteine-adding enzyme BshC [Vicinamibacterales bacterium]|nr:bacillithiol biosynthesis cysteine-adding enzyme BshC [Vicinamibacterales bacterium]
MQSDTTTSTPLAATAVDIRRFPWIRRFATDYAYAFDRVAPHFAGDPGQNEAWAAAIARRHAHSAVPGRNTPEQLARVLTAQQERRAAPAQAKAAAAILADPRAVAVITGQQAGLFGGPLFTLLKALTAMKLAQRIAQEHGVPVVPVFWIDAEDHDWPEVSSCTVLDSESTSRTITLGDLAGAGQLPIARLTLDDQITAAIDGLQSALPDTEFRDGLIHDIRLAYRPGRSMSEAFGRWIETILGPHGLVVYDSSDAASKPLVRQVFARELSHPGETARRASQAGTALVEAGYHAQVTPHEGAVSLFYLNGGREAVRYSDQRATVGDRETTLAALIDEVETAPEHFSPNVLLRPIVQDTLFPTVCYVAGPNELAYLGQLRDVYAHFDVPMPLMYQRASATIVDSATLRFMAKYGMPLESLQPEGEGVLNQLLQDQLPPTVEQALANVTTVVEERMASVAAAVPQIDPTLEGTVHSTLSRMQHDLRTLHNKVIQAAKRRDETLRRQFQRAQVLTFPNGHPQEREIGLVWFANRYGPALVDRLMEDLPLDMGHHWVLTI